jgi:hypothetical protein
MRNPYVQLLDNILPQDLIYYIDRYFEYPKKKKTSPVSPSFQRELQRIQSSPKYKTAMYMFGLEDFCLD